MILCRDCGGISMQDPLASVKVRRNLFEITQEGGSRERWMSTYRFQYSAKLNTWVLKKATLNVYDSATGNNTVKKDKVNHSKPIKLQDFNYNAFFNE